MSAIAPKEFRTACSRFATGVTIITTTDGTTRAGLTANSFSSVSVEPPLSSAVSPPDPVDGGSEKQPLRRMMPAEKSSQVPGRMRAAAYHRAKRSAGTSSPPTKCRGCLPWGTLVRNT